MKDKGHFLLSITKSIIRIGFCIWAWIINSLQLALFGLIFAEVVGILEELVDRR